MDTLVAAARPGVVGEQCWTAGAAGDAMAVELGGGDDAAKTK